MAGTVCIGGFIRYFISCRNVYRTYFEKVVGLDLEEGTKQGHVAHALLAGSLHIVGALILAACL